MNDVEEEIQQNFLGLEKIIEEKNTSNIKFISDINVELGSIEKSIDNISDFIAYLNKKIKDCEDKIPPGIPGADVIDNDGGETSPVENDATKCQKIMSKFIVDIKTKIDSMNLQPQDLEATQKSLTSIKSKLDSLNTMSGGSKKRRPRKSKKNIKRKSSHRRRKSTKRSSTKRG